jgi:hypothetical protein
VKRVMLLIAVTACGAVEQAQLASQAAVLGDVRYEAPAGWKQSHAREGSRLVARWAPDDASDTEVVSVFRTELRADKRAASLDDMQKMLVEAQRAMPHERTTEPHTFKTRAGLDAIEISVDFVPAQRKTTYRRVHAVVVSGSAILHVLYTAPTGDPDLRAYHMVLDTIHREEG